MGPKVPGGFHARTHLTKYDRGIAPSSCEAITSAPQEWRSLPGIALPTRGRCYGLKGFAPAMARISQPVAAADFDLDMIQ